MFTESSTKSYPKHEEMLSDSLPENSSLAAIIDLVGNARRLLDVGCATGYLSRSLAVRGHNVVGIDVNETALKEAAPYCAEVIAADLDVQPLARVLEGRGLFDAVVFGDVLEHLKNPLRVLEASRDILNERGFVVASLPNLAHGAVRLAMVSGRFDYQEFGLLDETHVRFFTRKTIEELFLSAGYRIENLVRIVLPLFEPSDLVPVVHRESFAAETIETIKRDPEHETLQFVVRAFPLSTEARIHALSRAFAEAGSRADESEARSASLEREIESLRRVERALREQSDRLAENARLHLAARDRNDIVIAAFAERTRDLQLTIQEQQTALSAVSGEIETLRSQTAQAIEAATAARTAESASRQECDELTREVAELREEHEKAIRRVIALRAERDEAVFRLTELRETLDATTSDFEDLQKRFLSFADEIEAGMRDEIQRVSQDVAEIRGSRVWMLRNRLRHFLGLRA